MGLRAVGVLYRDPIPFCPPRTELQLDADEVILDLPDGRRKRHSLDGCTPTTIDGCVQVREGELRPYRRFVRMLVLEARSDRHVYITPPDQGAVAPSVVRVPEAPTGAAILETRAFDAFADWVLAGGRLGAFSIADLARLAQIASPAFATIIGEVAAQRAMEIASDARGPMRNGFAGYDDGSLQPLVDAARTSPRAAEALVAALSLLAALR